MSLSILITLWAIRFISTAKSQGSICRLEPEVGPCRASIRKWYFDTTTETCKTFYYGGCQGNDNNFQSKSACESSCAYPKECGTNENSGPGRDIQCKSDADCCDYPEEFRCKEDKQKCVQDKPEYNRGTCYPSKGGQKCDENLQWCGIRGLECCDYDCRKKPWGYAGADEDDTCKLDPEVGPCRASIRKWYFDTTTNACQQFTYGGCQGNANNFESKGACEAECQGDLPVCSLDPEVGPCRASIRKWYFDTSTNTCQQFTYGGCQGNANNFESKGACEAECQGDLPVCSLDPEVGPCFAHFQRWYYDTKTKACEEFTYGGCQGNANNFESKRACEAECQGDLPVCSLDPEVGPCYAHFQRWYYDTKTKACEEFTYGGCQGNANNFESKRACESSCSGSGGRLDRPTDCCVTIISAREVQDVDPAGPGDPYITLVGVENNVPLDISNTATKSMNKNIYYGEEFCGGGPNTIQKLNNVRYESFVFKAYAEMRQSNDKLIGATNPIPLRDLECCDPQPREEQLIDSTGTKGVGFVKFKIQCDYNCQVDSYDKFNTLPPADDVKPCEYNPSAKSNKGKTDSGDDDVCSLDRVAGPCRAAFPRWYYDTNTKACEEFTYGGCQGNGNNFESKSACESKCSGGGDSIEVDVTTVATFKADESGVDGTVRVDENGNVFINLDLQFDGLSIPGCSDATTGVTYYIYNKYELKDGNLKSTDGGECTDDVIGDVFDPFGTELSCDDYDDSGDRYFECSIGDLSGRFGSALVLGVSQIGVHGNISEMPNDKESGFCASRLTPEALHGRSMVFRCDDESENILFCAPFVVSKEYLKE